MVLKFDCLIRLDISIDRRGFKIFISKNYELIYVSFLETMHWKILLTTIYFMVSKVKNENKSSTLRYIR